MARSVTVHVQACRCAARRSRPSLNEAVVAKFLVLVKLLLHYLWFFHVSEPHLFMSDLFVTGRKQLFWGCCWLEPWPGCQIPSPFGCARGPRAQEPHPNRNPNSLVPASFGLAFVVSLFGCVICPARGLLGSSLVGASAARALPDSEVSRVLVLFWGLGTCSLWGRFAVIIVTLI